MQPDDLTALVRDAFADALGRSVGDQEDFFDSGGDSLAAERILIAVSNRLGRRVQGWVLLDNPSIAAFSRALLQR